MKYTLLASLCFLGVSLFAQTSFTENKVIIVSCKSGDLYVDGTLVGKIDANDAKAQSLSIGEHYLQVKTATEKINLAAKIDLNTKDIIRIGCEQPASAVSQPISEPAKPILLLDKQLNLGGALTNEMQQNIVALDEGDNILLSCGVLNKKGAANISIREYFSNTEIFRNEGFNLIDQQKIPVPTKGIYIFTVTTNALFGKDIKLSVARIPSPNSNPNFKTSVRRYYDTTHTEVLTTDAVVHSTMNSNGNKTVQTISLPANTTYWTFWLGVGQDANAKMKQFVNGLSSIATKVSFDPLVLFGLKLIPSLPMFNGTATVGYYFMDGQNANTFIRNQPWSALPNIKSSNSVASDYGIINASPKELVLGMVNTNAIQGQNVNIRVVAFSVKTKLAMED